MWFVLELFSRLTSVTTNATRLPSGDSWYSENLFSRSMSSTLKRPVAA